MKKALENQAKDLISIASSINSLHLLLQEFRGRQIDQENANLNRDHRFDELEIATKLEKSKLEQSI